MQAPHVLYGLLMNALFETYGSSYRIGVERFRFSNGKPRQEVRMAVTTFMAMLCLAGIAFCVRFLVALGKECKAPSPSLLAGPAYRPNQEVVPKPRKRNNPVDRAAWERVARGPFSDTSGTLGNTNRSEKGYL
jgi:hypothetical protein